MRSRLPEQFDEAGLKVTVDSSGGKVQAKIRNAQLDLVNYMAVVGPKEAEAGQVALRDRIDGDLGSMPTAQAIARLQTGDRNTPSSPGRQEFDHECGGRLRRCRQRVLGPGCGRTRPVAVPAGTRWS